MLYFICVNFYAVLMAIIDTIWQCILLIFSILLLKEGILFVCHSVRCISLNKLQFIHNIMNNILDLHIYSKSCITQSSICGNRLCLEMKPNIWGFGIISKRDVEPLHLNCTPYHSFRTYEQWCQSNVVCLMTMDLSKSGY